MVKKIAIVLGILVAIGGLAGGIAFYKLNESYGLMTAKVVRHNAQVSQTTRLRISVDTLRLGEDLLPYLPENLPLPGWLPWDLPALLPKILPREVAILGGSDYAANAYNLTVFINEQKGGPMLPKLLNDQVQLPNRFPAVAWDDEGFQLKERGILTVEGQLPLPLGLEDRILETWSLDPPTEALQLYGKHMAEGVIDNRNGDILTLIGGLAPIWGTTLDQINKESNSAVMLGMLDHIHDIRIAVDLKNTDTLLLQIRIHAEKEVGGQLEFFIPFAMPMLAQQIKAQYGLTLESENTWNPDDETYTVDLSVTGVEEKFRDYFRSAIPTSTAAPK